MNIEVNLLRLKDSDLPDEGTFTPVPGLTGQYFRGGPDQVYLAEVDDLDAFADSPNKKPEVWKITKVYAARKPTEVDIAHVKDPKELSDIAEELWKEFRDEYPIDEDLLNYKGMTAVIDEETCFADVGGQAYFATVFDGQTYLLPATEMGLMTDRTNEIKPEDITLYRVSGKLRTGEVTIEGVSAEETRNIFYKGYKAYLDAKRKEMDARPEDYYD